MLHRSVLKDPGEKLIKILLEEENNVIIKVRITGDFFMHPEEKITMIENSLIDVRLDESEIRSTIQDIVVMEGIKLFGVSAASLAKAIMLSADNIGKA